jgi:hypothetical protein
LSFISTTEIGTCGIRSPEKIPEESLGKACAMGALVAQEKGANPVITEQILSDFMNQVN